MRARGDPTFRGTEQGIDTGARVITDPQRENSGYLIDFAVGWGFGEGQRQFHAERIVLRRCASPAAGQERSLYDFAAHPQPELELTFSVTLPLAGLASSTLTRLWLNGGNSLPAKSAELTDESGPLSGGDNLPFPDRFSDQDGTRFPDD